MKKLKKGLSLVLVLAMVVGLLGTSVFAAQTSYDDDSKITQTEAVAVMSDMGIIDGVGNNLFNPEGAFTRAQAAKIVTYMQLGPEKAEALTAKNAPFTDVSADYWAAAYISYAAANGIIDGFGDNTFRPGNTLTREQWLTMLLAALGYDKEEYGLVNENWAANATALALKTGLVSAEEAKLTFNRDTAVLYAWNALSQATEGLKDLYTVTLDDGTTKNFDSAADAYAYAYTNSAKNPTITANNTLGSKVFDLVKTADQLDIYGRDVTVYTYNSGKTKTSLTGELVATYNTAVSVKDLKKVLGDDAIIKEHYANGLTRNVAQNIDLSTKSITDELGGQGTVLEFYLIKDNEYKLVEIHTYSTKIGEIGKYQKTLTLPNAAENKSGTPAINDTLTVSVEGLAKNDVVSYQIGYDRTTGKAVADEVTVLTGTKHYVNAVATAYVRLDGEDVFDGTQAYKAAHITGADTLTLKNTVITYFDKFGNILRVDQPATTAAPQVQPDGYFYVITEQTQLTAGFAGDLYDGAYVTTASARAKVIDLATGEVKVVERALVQEENTFYWADQNGNKLPYTIANGKSEETDTNAAVYPYYILADGTYAFGTAINASLANIDVSVAKGTLKVTATRDGAAVGTHFANDSTKLTVITADKSGTKNSANHDNYTGKAGTTLKTETYVGVDNFPTSVSGVGYVLNGNNDQYATEIVIITEPVVAAATQTYDYAYYLGYVEEDDGENYIYKFNVGGDTTIYATSETKIDFEVGKLYQIELGDEVGTYEGSAVLKLKSNKVAETASVTDGTVIATSGSGHTYVISNNTQYEVTSSTLVYDATEEKSGIVDGATVTLYVSSTNKVVFAVVTAAPAK
jgi:hypothetical protein